MTTRNRPHGPSAIRLWARTFMFLLVGAIAAAICAYYGWWITMTIILVPTLFFAWWVSPFARANTRRGSRRCTAAPRITRSSCGHRSAGTVLKSRSAFSQPTPARPG